MQRYGNRLLGYWENKEAEERNTPSTSGVGLPSEDQVKQAQAVAKATPAAPAAVEEDRSASNPKRESTESRPSSTRPSERDDRPSHTVPSRGTSFENGPANGQPPASALTTA